MRKSYTTKFKLKLIKEISRSSLSQVCREKDHNERKVRKWKNNPVLLDDKIQERNSKRKHGCARKPIIKDMENEILDWILSQRHQS